MAAPVVKKVLERAAPEVKPTFKKLADRAFELIGIGIRFSPSNTNALVNQLEAVANGHFPIIVGGGSLSQEEAEIMVAVLKEAGGIAFDQQTGRYVLYDINAEIPLTSEEQADTVFGQMVAMYVAQAQQARENDDATSVAKVHGNSKESKRPQHMYEIFRFNRNEPHVQEVVKTGISGTDLLPKPNLTSIATGNVKNSQWTSTRATAQVNVFNKREPEGSNIVYGYRIKEINMPDRATALQKERENTRRLRETGHQLVEQRRPNPEAFDSPFAPNRWITVTN